MRQPALTVAEQDFFIRQYFPGFRRLGKAGTGRWIGDLQPASAARTYTVRLDYNAHTLPQVWVITPALEPGAPHVFREGSLCLYWGKRREWTPAMRLVDTIIPWTAEWLLYYEWWLDTGTWYGSSSHAQAESPKAAP